MWRTGHIYGPCSIGRIGESGKGRRPQAKEQHEMGPRAGVMERTIWEDVSKKTVRIGTHLE